MEVVRICILHTLHPSCQQMPTTKVDTGFVNFVVEPSAMHALGSGSASAEPGDSQQAFEPTCSCPRRNDGANNYYEHETAPSTCGFVCHDESPFISWCISTTKFTNFPRYCPAFIASPLMTLQRGVHRYSRFCFWNRFQNGQLPYPTRNYATLGILPFISP